MWSHRIALKICAVFAGIVGTVTAATLGDFMSSNSTVEATTLPFLEKKKFKDNAATRCDSIEGKWYNQLGSEMIIVDENGMLVGEYRTAVESKPGAAGGTFSILRGVQKAFDNANAVGFSVAYSKGKSLASWIGECTKCEGKEVLRTTWLLRSRQDSLSDQWKSTRVNEDIFFRADKLEGPRKHLGTNVPKRPAEIANETVSRVAREVELNESAESNDFTGKWYSNDGVELELFTDNDVGTIEGLYMGGVGKEYPIFGSFAPGQPNGTLGLYTTIDDSESALVGVGQYYTDAGNEVLETSWLNRQVGDASTSAMSPVSIARRTFKRTPQPKYC